MAGVLLSEVQVVYRCTTSIDALASDLEDVKTALLTHKLKPILLLIFPTLLVPA